MQMFSRISATTALLFALAGLGALLASGCGHRRYQEGPPDPAKVEEHVKSGVDRMLSKIDATDIQRQKVYELRDRLMPDVLAMVSGHYDTMKEVKNLWTSPDKLDPAKLDALCAKRGDEMKAMFHKFNVAAAEFHDLLTPEQRAKLVDMAERHH